MTRPTQILISFDRLLIEVTKQRNACGYDPKAACHWERLFSALYLMRDDVHMGYQGIGPGLSYPRGNLPAWRRRET